VCIEAFLGANAILGVSLAVCKAGAAQKVITFVYLASSLDEIDICSCASFLMHLSTGGTKPLVPVHIRPTEFPSF